jgi:hypothetical protein
MFSRRFSNNPLLLGLLIGLVFGAVNLVFTWLDPLEDDTTGLIVAFATMSVFAVLNFVRFHVFLSDLTGRADWQGMMARFRASDYNSLRTFVTLESIKAAAVMIGVGSVIGTVMGVIGGLLGLLSREWRPQLPNTPLQPTAEKRGG